MRKFFVIAAATALMASSAAAIAPGSYGLGFTSSAAPVGGYYQATDVLGITGGLGLESFDSGNTNFYLEVGLPITMHSGDRSWFGIRPGVGFANFSPDDSSSKTAFGNRSLADGTALQFQAWLFYMWMATDNVGINFYHGLNINTYSPEEGDSVTDFTTAGANATGGGIYYFFE
ncbi:MAG: hypothetical protein HKN20_03625 [Gemmatimonadetes bacterium]|nr:hypothetical protein [Gemmatimonadota bacterium]